ncbi:MAG: histidine kinase [Bacteroidetes bacterium]|nr:histidine kinase [Bacteroidota bacterium]MBS1932691.1 histidine kinase [Bacteroidota bacterium]
MKQPWYSRRWFVVALHICAWALLFSLPYLLRTVSDHDHHPQHDKDDKSNAGTYVSIFMNLAWVALFYLNAFVLIPRLIYKKRYLQFTGLHVLLMLCAILEFSILMKIFFSDLGFDLKPALFNFFIYLFIAALSTAYKLISDKINADKLVSEKENENLKTELSFLRSQVSPHFMFNVLNNMVALARKKSDLLEPSLIKLSSLMRYMLYEADEDKVSLEKEAEYLQSYIDLQRQRFGKNVEINFSTEPFTENYQIEPMLLIPFVENAFKHGSGIVEDAQIDISLIAKNNILQFFVRNKYNPQSSETKDKTSGIGLTNVKRRLNLLYKSNHSLLITQKDNWFTISLQLNLH